MRQSGQGVGVEGRQSVHWVEVEGRQSGQGVVASLVVPLLVLEVDGKDSIAQGAVGPRSCSPLASGPKSPLCKSMNTCYTLILLNKSKYHSGDLNCDNGK